MLTQLARKVDIEVPSSEVALALPAAQGKVTWSCPVHGTVSPPKSACYLVDQVFDPELLAREASLLQLCPLCGSQISRVSAIQCLQVLSWRVWDQRRKKPVWSSALTQPIIQRSELPSAQAVGTVAMHSKLLRTVSDMRF